MAKQRNIISTCGQGFLEQKENSLRILHVKGTAYERGFQHGTLLANEIEECVHPGITAYALALSRPWGTMEGGDPDKGVKKLWAIKEAMEPWIPENIKREIKGISEALTARGSNLTYDDILLWNIAVDAELFYFHPNTMLIDKPGVRTPYPPVACTTFSAFGKAMPDKKMLYFKNCDFVGTAEAEKNVYVMIVNPSDGGNSCFIPIMPGLLGLDGGINEKGICFGMNYSGTQPETAQGVGICFKSEIFLRHIDNVDDAVNLLNLYPRAGGLLYHIADYRSNRAVIVEATANEIAVRSTKETGKDILWASNHYNCYPGWQGYQGFNMVTNQAKAYGLEDISTIEKWQQSMEKCFMEEGSIGRYARLRQLLNESYGKITVDKAVQMGSDCYDLKTNKLIGKDQLCGFTTVSQFLAKNVPVSSDVQYYKSSKKGVITESIGNLWSWVAVPETGEVQIADGPIPANRGEFHSFNLYEELEASL